MSHYNTAQHSVGAIPPHEAAITIKATQRKNKRAGKQAISKDKPFAIFEDIAPKSIRVDKDTFEAQTSVRQLRETAAPLTTEDLKDGLLLDGNFMKVAKVPEPLLAPFSKAATSRSTSGSSTSPPLTGRSTLVQSQSKPSSPTALSFSPDSRSSAAVTMKEVREPLELREDNDDFPPLGAARLATAAAVSSSAQVTDVENVAPAQDSFKIVSSKKARKQKVAQEVKPTTTPATHPVDNKITAALAVRRAAQPPFPPVAFQFPPRRIVSITASAAPVKAAGWSVVSNKNAKKAAQVPLKVANAVQRKPLADTKPVVITLIIAKKTALVAPPSQATSTPAILTLPELPVADTVTSPITETIEELEDADSHGWYTVPIKQKQGSSKPHVASATLKVSPNPYGSLNRSTKAPSTLNAVAKGMLVSSPTPSTAFANVTSATGTASTASLTAAPAHKKSRAQRKKDEKTRRNAQKTEAAAKKLEQEKEAKGSSYRLPGDQLAAASVFTLLPRPITPSAATPIETPLQQSTTEQQIGFVPEVSTDAQFTFRMPVVQIQEDLIEDAADQFSTSETDIAPAVASPVAEGPIHRQSELLDPSEGAFEHATYQLPDTLNDDFEEAVPVQDAVVTTALPASDDQPEDINSSTVQVEDSYDHATMESRITLSHGFDDDVAGEESVGHASDYATFESRMALGYGFEDTEVEEELFDAPVISVPTEQPEVIAVGDNVQLEATVLYLDFTALESRMMLQHGSDDEPQDEDVSEMDLPQLLCAEYKTKESHFLLSSDAGDIPEADAEDVSIVDSLSPVALTSEITENNCTLNEEHVELSADILQLCDVALAEMAADFTISEKVTAEQVTFMQDTMAYGRDVEHDHETSSWAHLAASIKARHAPPPEVGHQIGLPQIKLTDLLKTLEVNNGRITLEGVAAAFGKCAEEEMIRQVKARPKLEMAMRLG